MRKKTAFVIMPIGENGSEDSKNYEALYSNFLEGQLSEQGFDVRRADKVSRSGSIFKDIIKRLIEADLVVADLSSLNPNVMIELGIRYSVKKSGTILICDRNRTNTLPFDLKDYRVIFYDDTREAGLSLIRGIKEYASSARSEDNSIDSPVFNHYPNWLSGDATEDLKREIDELKSRLSSVGEREASTLPSELGVVNLGPSEILARAMSEIEEGNVPWILLDKAAVAASNRNIAEFLKCVEAVMSLRAITLSDREFADVYYLAQRLDLRNVLPAVIDLGLSLYPDSDELKRTKMAHMAHSVHQHERQKAKDSIASKLRIDIVKGSIDADKIRHAGTDIALLSIFLDALHRDQEDELALKITAKMYELLPKNSVVLRNYARAVERLQGPGKAFDYYMKAVQDCEDVDTLSARWLAVELWQRADLRGAIEVCIFACMLDLDDATSFGRLARYISEILQPQNVVHDSMDGIGDGKISFDLLAEVIVYGQSCPSISLEERGVFESAMRNADVTSEAISRHVDKLGMLSRKERANYIRDLYAHFATELTTKVPRLRSTASSPVREGR